MIKVRNHSIKNSFSEFTIHEFEQINNILNDPEADNIEKYLKVIQFLGLPESIIDELTDDEFFEIVKHLSVKKDVDPTMIDKIQIGEVNYIAHDGDFKIKVKELALIEKYVRQNVKDFLSKAIAIIFKQEGLTNKEHFNEKHIEAKARLFKDLKVELIYPYIMHIAIKLTDKIKMINGL